MRLFVFVFLLAQALRVAAAPVDEARFIKYCEDNLPAARVVVSADAPVEAVDDTLAARDVAKKLLVPRGYGALGFMEKSQKLQTKWSSAVLQYPGHDLFCARVSANLKVVSIQHKIYLARELGDSQCARDTVLAHERQHASNAIKHLEQTVEFFSQKKPADLNKVFVGSRADLEAAMSAFVQAQYESPILEALSQTLPEDVRMDDEDYEKNRQLCNGHLKKVAMLSLG